ncbi:MAG: hypothetical protein E7254_09975 [Lachnospiraceae bacterium]|nr:hypothetical protein [Lachnospiraceae bacterium]
MQPIRAFGKAAKYVIHAVGPRWSGGENNEPKRLYSAYKESHLRAKWMIFISGLFMVVLCMETVHQQEFLKNVDILL